MTAATDRRSFALVVTGALLWGTGGLSGAALGAVGGLSPSAVAAVRLGLGGAVLVIGLLIARRPARPVGRAAVRRVVLLGVLLAAYQAAYFAAVRATSVSEATFIALGAAPVLVAVVGVVRHRRRPGGTVVLATALALLGLALLVLVGGPAPGAAGRDDGVGGPLLALLAAAAFAGIIGVNRRPVPGLEPVTTTAAAFVLGGALLVPWALLAGSRAGEATASHPVHAWLLAAFLAVVPTALAWWAYLAGGPGVPATTAALAALLEPLTAALVAALLLGERLGAAGLVGGLLLLGATVAVGPRPRRWGRLAYDGPRSASTTRLPGERSRR